MSNRRNDSKALLRQVAVRFTTLGQFLDACRSAYGAVRQGRPPKVDPAKIFQGIAQYRLTYFSHNQALPTKYRLSQHISREFCLSFSTAKTYVGIYVRWRLKGFAQLKSEDHRWMQTHYGSVWKSFVSRSWLSEPDQRRSARAKAIERTETAIRPLELQLSRAVSLHGKGARKDSRVINSRAEVFQLLDSL